MARWYYWLYFVLIANFFFQYDLNSAGQHSHPGMSQGPLNPQWTPQEFCWLLKNILNHFRNPWNLDESPSESLNVKEGLNKGGNPLNQNKDHKSQEPHRCLLELDHSGPWTPALLLEPQLRLTIPEVGVASVSIVTPSWHFSSQYITWQCLCKNCQIWASADRNHSRHDSFQPTMLIIWILKICGKSAEMSSEFCRCRFHVGLMIRTPVQLPARLLWVRWHKSWYGYNFLQEVDFIELWVTLSMKPVSVMHYEHI